jgi:hypothetical protein
MVLIVFILLTGWVQLVLKTVLDTPHFEYAYREVLFHYTTQKNTDIDVFQN